MRREVRRSFAYVLLASYWLTTTGCTVWTRTPVTALAQPLPWEVLVWVHDTSYVVHEPTIRGDSLVGIRGSGKNKGFQIEFPVAAVDSLRTRQVTVGGTFLALVGTTIGMLMLVLCAYYCGDSNGD